jgi:hypothetical protein
METPAPYAVVNDQLDPSIEEIYKPHLKQQAAHRAFLVDDYRRGTLFWGRQVGKSLWSVKHLEMAACIEQGQYFIVFGTHKHAKDVMWRQYLHMIPKSLIYTTNSTDLTITFNYIKMPIYIPGKGWIAVKHNTNKPRSTIQLLGSDYSDDHRGRKANGMIFDEYQDQDPNAWEAVYKFFFTTTNGWACFMGTAKGYNHWYDLLQYSKESYAKKTGEWFYLEATWRDNPMVTKEWFERERREAEAREQLDIFMQEVELQFRTVQGSVYPRFDRKIHVVDANDPRVPEDGTCYVTWDFGWAEGHPMAINIVIIDNTGTWWVIDEIHGFQLEIKECARMLREKLAGRRVTGVICDSARPDLIDMVRQENFPAIPAPKKAGSIVSGITLLGTKLRPKVKLLGMPEPDIYFTANCKKTIYQMENYKYKENKADRPASDLPVKHDDDHPDALRYLALWLKWGMAKQETPIVASVKFNSYGLL